MANLLSTASIVLAKRSKSASCQKLSGNFGPELLVWPDVRHSPAIVQVVDVPLLIPSKKTETGETCPECGGPAEVDLFWSTSPDNPEVRVLKKQTCCGGRPGRSSRFRTQPLARCPVQVVIVESQPIAECEVIAQAVEAEPAFRPKTLTRQLDKAIELLARLDEDACLQLVQIARLTREQEQRKQALKARIR